MRKRQVWSFLILTVFFLGAVKAVPSAEVRRVGLALERLHYSSQRSLDDLKSRKIFEHFVEGLDPEKVYFTHRDMNYLETLYAHRLDDDIRSGTLESAPKIYSHFKRRVRERLGEISETVEGTSEQDLGRVVEKRGKSSSWIGGLDEMRGAWRDKITGELARIHSRSKEPSELRLQKAKSLLVKKYNSISDEIEGLEVDSVKEAFLSSACQAYDPHSDYLGPKKMTEFDISMGLQLGGIGAVLGDEGDGVKVISLVPGGPAAGSGKLFKGDKIYAVGDCQGETHDISGLSIDKVVEMIRGEKGSRICLEVAGETGGAVRGVELVRDQVQLNDQAVKGAIIDNGGTKIGLLIVPSFYHDGAGRSVARDAEEVVTKLVELGAEAMLVDIRQDGGGVLDEAVKLAGIFIPRSPVVQIKNGNGRIQVKTAPEMAVKWDGPLVVLVDRYSASASEIFCGAIQDHGAGVVIGDSQTFGKGTVQAVMELERTPLLRLFTGEPSVNNGAVKVTVQKFYRASGLSTQARGVSSDIVIPSPTDLEEIGEASLKNHLPFDKADTLALSKGRFSQDDVKWMRGMSHQRGQDNGGLLKRIEKLEMINGSPEHLISLKGEILDTHNGTMDQEGVIVSSLRGGATQTKRAKLHTLYEGSPMPRFPAEDRDFSLEEGLMIAKDLVSVFSGGRSSLAIESH